MRGLGAGMVDRVRGDGVGVAWGRGVVGFNVDLGIPGLFSCCGGWRFCGRDDGLYFSKKGVG